MDVFNAFQLEHWWQEDLKFEHGIKYSTEREICKLCLQFQLVKSKQITHIRDDFRD